MKDIEIWKDIPGFEGRYQVSNYGRVKSFNFRNTGRANVLSTNPQKDGYPSVTLLLENGKAKKFRVHRLVAKAFLENYSDSLEVDHIDTNKENNNLSNLRMCTRKENCNNELTLQHKAEAMRGEKSPMWGKHLSQETKKKLSKANKGKNNPNWGKTYENNPNAKAVICLENGIVYLTAKRAGEELKVNSGSISQNCRGRLNHAGGYHFKYYEPQKRGDLKGNG